MRRKNPMVIDIWHGRPGPVAPQVANSPWFTPW